MTSFLIIFRAAFLIARLMPVAYLVTLLMGFIWRFALLAGYAFAIQVILYSAGLMSETNDLIVLQGIDNSLIVLVIFLLFLMAGGADLAFSKLRNTLEMAIDKEVLSVLKMNKHLNFISKQRKTYCAQMLMKTFDVVYSSLLILISLITLFALVPTLAMILLVGVLLTTGVIGLMKRSHQRNVKQINSKGSARKIRHLKLVRSAKIRALMTIVAGIFFGILAAIVFSGEFAEVSIVFLAIAAFCVRFFVSFCSIFYVNSTACFDEILLIKEFYSNRIQQG